MLKTSIKDKMVVWTASCCKKCCTIQALCGLALSSMNIGLSANAWLSKWGTTHGASTLSRYFLGWTIRTWRRVHWSDESRFLLRPTDGRARVWCQRNTSFQDNHILGTTAFGGGGVTVWDCFSLSANKVPYMLYRVHVWRHRRPWNCLNSLLL
jgi:hypothetical protein